MKEIIQEKLTEIENNEVNLKMDGLKPDINNLLQMYLPLDLTLKEVEAIACAINHVIWFPKEYLDKAQKVKDSLTP